MPAIDRPGTFRGMLTEHAASQTKNGFPQLVCRLKATEYYDEDAGVWQNWTEYDMDIVAYFVLFSNKGPCLNYKQVQLALGWDGGSFASLDGGDWSTCVVQFRVEWHEYDGNKTLRVNWIDAQDAEPGRTIKKLDAKDLQALDAKFRTAVKPATPASAPKGRPTPPPPPATADPTPAAENEAAPAPATAAPTPDAPSGAPSDPPAAAKKRKKKSKKDATVTGLPTACTKIDAWGKVAELKTDTVTDEKLAEAWLAACDEVAGEDSDEGKITTEQWATIRDKTLDRIDHLPF